MTRYVALLRAVNVGGTGKLPMTELRAMCEAAGFANVRTYIASGNVVFDAGLAEAAVKVRLEAALADYAGKAVGAKFVAAKPAYDCSKLDSLGAARTNFMWGVRFNFRSRENSQLVSH